MGDDGLKVGAQIRKFVIITIRVCYRSVCNHPFVVGLLLLLLFLYRSFPFLFSLLASTSPVLVCTAVLLGTLLSFGESNVVPESEEEEKPSCEIVKSEKGGFESSNVVEEDECISRDIKYTELRREFVKSIDEEPLLDYADRLDKSELDHDDAEFSSMSTDHIPRELEFEKDGIDESKDELESNEIDQTVDVGDQLFRMGVRVGFSHGEILGTGFSSVEKVQAEHFEDYKSAEGSVVDVQMRDHLVSSLESRKQLDGVVVDSLSSTLETQHENSEDYKSAEGSVDAQITDQIEPSLASWKEFDVLDHQLSTEQEAQEEKFEAYNIGEGSSEAQLRDYIESSLRSWKQMGSDNDEYGESDSGSDGAESSSPDASMADIIPLLDELDPLLDDEDPQVSNLSRQSSAATMERSVMSPDSSIHSDDESDQKDDEADYGKSDVNDDNEEETEVGKESPVKSAIMWTEDDQKNLMDLGTSELERNQRLESLIARRRAKKMTGDRNLIDLDGMDLPFPVVPISTKRHNPFDFPQDSYADLGLPPIPGSAPSIMLTRRNPFDLPYDSSEEKPDLTGDSFQQEFTELTQREALFRRNETFNMGSSGFDFGRPSRFRPYFVPERRDSDMMSYSSLQRQLSELSESKASSVAETESTSMGRDQEEKKLIEHDNAQEVEASSENDHASVLVEHGSQSYQDLGSLSSEELVKEDLILSDFDVELGRANYSAAADPEVMGYTSLQRQLSECSESKESSDAEKDSTSVVADQEEKKLMEHDSAQEVGHGSEIDHASCLMEQGSQSSEDLDSSSDEEKEKKDFVLSVLEVELGRAKSSSVAGSYTSETVESSSDRLDFKENDPPAEQYLSHSKVSHSDIQSMTELIQPNHNVGSSLSSAPKAFNDEIMEDVDNCLLNREKSQANNLLNVDIPVKYSLESSASELTTGFSLETSEHSHAAGVDDNHQKEPIYDFSPLKKNHSLSSSSSDLQRETSGIDLYHLSRDLFIGEELNVNNQDTDNISQHIKQDEYGNCLTVNDIGGRSRLDSNNYSESNQLPGSSPALVVAEDEDLLNMDSAGGGSTNRVSDDKVSPQEVDQSFAQENAEIHFENNLEYTPPADSVLVQEIKKVTKLADSIPPSLSSSKIELKDEIQEEIRVSQQFQVPNSSLTSHDNDSNESLNFTLDESHFFPLDSDICDPCDDSAGQEQSIIHSNLEGVDQVNNINEPAKHEILCDPSQSIVSSSQPEDSETTIAELAMKDHVQDINEIKRAYMEEKEHDVFDGFEGPIADEHNIYEDKSDFKAMDESLLTELDAVGDFRVSNNVPNLESSMINLNAAIDTNIPAEAIGEVHTSTEMLFGPETMFRDGTHVENFESEINVTGIYLPEEKESNLDSQTGNVSTNLLDLEAQSVEDIDPAFTEVSEGVENSMVAESVQAEITRRDEVLFPKSELLREEIEPGRFTSEVVTIPADAVFSNRDIVPERIQSDSAFLEGHDLDSDCNETISEMLMLDAEIFEQSGEDVEKVEPEINKSEFVGALQTVTEIAVSSAESMPLLIDRDRQEIDGKPPVEASNARDLEIRDQTEGVESMEFESLLIDRDIKEGQQSLVLDASDSLAFEPEDDIQAPFAPKMPVLESSIALAIESEYQIERITDEPLLLEKDSKKRQESVVGVGIGSARDSEPLMEKFDSTISESFQIDDKVRETQELLGHEGSVALASVSEDQMGNDKSSEPLQLDRNIHAGLEPSAVEESIPSALEAEEEEIIGSEEFEPLQRDMVVEELRDWHVVEGISPTESDPSETDADIKVIPRSPTSQASIPVPKSADQLLTAKYVESGPLLIDRNIGVLQELPGVEAKFALEAESEGQLEKVGLAESEPLQMDGDLKEIHDSPVPHKSDASANELKDQMEIISQMEVVEVQALQPEIDVPNVDDSIGTSVDPSTTVTESTNNKVNC